MVGCAGLQLEPDPLVAELLRHCAESPRIRTVLPGQQRHDDERAEQHGREGRGGIFQFEADDTHGLTAVAPRPWVHLDPLRVCSGHITPGPRARAIRAFHANTPVGGHISLESGAKCSILWN